MTLTAVFASEQQPPVVSYTVTLYVNKPEMGVVSGEGTYAKDAEANISATANAGYRFVKWSDGNTQATRTIIVDSNISLIAIFEALNETVYYTLTVTTNDFMMGAISGSGEYEAGTYATIQAFAFENYSFRVWSDGNSTNPRQILMNSDKEIQAIFVPDKFTLTLTCDPMKGKVIGSGKYPYDSEVLIEARPRAGYKFLNWSDGIGDNPRTVYIDGDIELEALFVVDYTGVEAIEEQKLKGESARKIMIEGHLYIITPDGKIYDAVGAQVK